MGDNLDIMSLVTGIAGIADQEFRVGPEADKAKQEQFDTAEGRHDVLRGNVQGDPGLQGVPQNLIDRARDRGELIVKRPDGSFIVATPEDAQALAASGSGEVVLATLDANGECATVEVSSESLDGGYIKLYAMFSNNKLIAHYSYRYQ